MIIRRYTMTRRKKLESDYNGTVVTIRHKSAPSKQKKVKIRNYVYRAEELYGVKRYFVNTLQSIPAYEFIKLLYIRTVLSNNEICWLTDMEYSSIKTITSRVKRPKFIGGDESPQKSKMNPEFLQRVAMFGLSELYGDNIKNDEETILGIQADLAAKGMKMLQLETQEVFATKTMDKYVRMFQAIEAGSKVWKDASGVLNTKDKSEIEIKRIGLELKKKQLDMDSKGKNVAITIMEEYGSDNVLSDHDLIFLVSDFLRKTGYDEDKIQDINKQAMATIHYKRGDITEEMFNEVMSGKKEKLENIKLGG